MNCKQCSSKKTYDNKWYILGSSHICKKCYTKNYKQAHPKVWENYQKKYFKTFNGVLRSMYANMVRRVRDINNYKGLPICTRKAFYAHAAKSKILEVLYKNWVKSNYIYNLRPTPNRIKDSSGYMVPNINFLTFADNVADANIKRVNK